ncbi:MAG TPA: DNA polymerase III subunit delta [Anaerolineales bacterium]|nr:DNA polymerase III subunit delta [Anaerolineales bacterium]
MAEPAAVFILHGNDELAIAAHIDKLCASLGDPATAGLNIARFDGRSGLDFEAFNTAVNAAPFLAPRRLVVLAHPLAAFPSAQARKKFTDLLDKAQPTTLIVLVEAEELKRDHWLLKWAASREETGTSQAGGRADVHAYNLPKRWEMPRWIESEARKQGGKIEPDAAARLAEMVGEDTRIAAQELTKLLTYVNYQQPIRLLDVEKVSIVSAQGSIFELVDALGQNDGRKAQRILHQLLENEEAFELWGMVIRQFRLLLQARELLDERATAAEIQRSLGLHEFVAQKVSQQAGRFSISALEKIYHKLLEIDEAAKTSQVPLDLALDTLIVELVPK